MTPFIDSRAMAAFIQARRPEKIISELAEYIQADYAGWEYFDKTPRLATHSRVGVIELMPVADRELYAFKYVNGHPQNALQGKLTVTGFGVLADVATGYPLLLSEMTMATALRTAAMSALAARYMARRDSASMAIIGNGAQSEFQVLAFYALLGIRRFQAFDIDPSATAKLIRNLAGYTDICITAAPTIDAAVDGVDIITTVTADKTNATILGAEHLRPGIHINAVGGDCPGKTELDPGVLQASTVFVEYAPQSRIEGELQQMPVDFPVIEFWEVVLQAREARTGDAQITLFDSVGFALEDFSTLRYLRDHLDSLAKIDLCLIPSLHDPRDLFGYSLS